MIELAPLFWARALVEHRRVIGECRAVRGRAFGSAT
jgi:hypothetical protein